MKNVKKGVEALIGNTPLVELYNYQKVEGLEAVIMAKLECFNPGGSVKDRVALNMIQDAESKGRLKAGGTIVEPTSGNTGVGLAMLAGARGYKAVLTMPETMSIERVKILKAYGAEIVLTPGSQGMKGAVDKAIELSETIPGAVLMGQFVNPANPASHYMTTGPEIWEATEGNVDFFVSGIGTGGTITGVGRFLKEKNPNIKIVAVEPEDSPLLSQGKSGPHSLQGIGANFVPEILDRSIYDEVIPVPGNGAMESLKTLGSVEGFFVGITSGAALWAATIVAKRPENKGKNIVVLLPDTGERYLSLL